MIEKSLSSQSASDASAQNGGGKTPARANSTLEQRLDAYYRQIQAIILCRQNPITGLLPASTAITAHGDYTDAWVRDNVYSILAVWGLALAYRKLDDDSGRTFELEHSVIKLMRGLLVAMIKQAPKVERFKDTQLLLDAMHAKYDTNTGDVVVGDTEWGHLQLDATSLYLLILAQMTTSGLAIVYTIDEVNFIQNLVYYIGRAYRTPDFGIWERGNKINKGDAELNASSVGMAKAALEAMNGLNLFGVHGSQASVVHVLPDEIARSRMVLESLLPRESNSKEVDAALLSILGFPAFAIEDVALLERTHQAIIDKLQGRYGCKRFLRDGHQTVLEDKNRLHYEPLELKQFEHLECEWPLFFTYLVLDGLFRQNSQQVQTYRDRLQPLFVEKDGWQLLPELYYVPSESVEAERADPHSQTRQPNENIPLVWAQSLYLLGELLAEGLIALGDIDPLARHLRIGKHRHPVVQIALLSEDQALQAELETQGIATQTPLQLEPIQVRRPHELAQVYAQIGRNHALDLSGRPVRRLRSLTTSQIFRIRGDLMVFLPAFLDQEEFYLTLDYHFLVDHLKSELAYIQRHWNHLGRPILTILISRTMLEADSDVLLNLMQELKAGSCNGVQVQLGTLNQLLLTAGSERIDFIHDFEFSVPLQEGLSVPTYLTFEPDRSWPLSHIQEFLLECETNTSLVLESLEASDNLFEQVELLQTLYHHQGLDFDTGFAGSDQPVSVAHLLNEIYHKAGKCKLWAIVRRAAGLLNKVDIGLSDAVTDILVRQKRISVGKSYSEGSLMVRPMSHFEIIDKINQFCREDIRDRVLSQEILIYLSLLIKSEPPLFEGMVTLRIGYFILMITSELARELQVTQDEAYEQLMQMSPFEIKQRLHQTLTGFDQLSQGLFQQESLHLKQAQNPIDWIVEPETDLDELQSGSWYQKRIHLGRVSRVPQDFYPSVWTVLQHCKGLVIGDKLERRNRLESALILSEMTPGEKNFILRVEPLLNKIAAPQYRQVCIETLMELAAIARANPDLQIEEYLVLDVLIGHAVRLAYLDQFPEHRDRYDEFKGEAWPAFYDSSPHHCATYVMKALQFLTELGEQETQAVASSG